MEDMLYKWILIFGLLTAGVILLPIGFDLTIFFLLVLNIFVVLIMSGIFATLLKKQNRNDKNTSFAYYRWKNKKLANSVYVGLLVSL